MIDNYDSFTYNVVQYLLELGAEVEVHRNDEITVDEIRAMAPEKIVISPGPCTPNEAGISLQVVDEFSGRIPLLGICLGHQSIGQAMGGSIVHRIEVLPDLAPEIEILTPTKWKVEVPGLIEGLGGPYRKYMKPGVTSGRGAL